MTKTELVRFYYTLWFAIASEAKFIEPQFINTICMNMMVVNSVNCRSSRLGSYVS